MEAIKKHLDLLGYKAKDKITGYEGVIECISFDLYGCVQATLRRPVNDKHEIENSHWFDVTRLDVDKTDRVMDIPDFNEGYVAEGKKGAANKPDFIQKTT